MDHSRYVQIVPKSFHLAFKKEKRFTLHTSPLYVQVISRYKVSSHSCTNLTWACSGNCGTETLIAEIAENEQSENWCQIDGISTRLVPTNNPLTLTWVHVSILPVLVFLEWLWFCSVVHLCISWIWLLIYSIFYHFLRHIIDDISKVVYFWVFVNNMDQNTHIRHKNMQMKIHSNHYFIFINQWAIYDLYV